MLLHDVLTQKVFSILQSIYSWILPGIAFFHIFTIVDMSGYRKLCANLFHTQRPWPALTLPKPSRSALFKPLKSMSSKTSWFLMIFRPISLFGPFCHRPQSTADSLDLWACSTHYPQYICPISCQSEKLLGLCRASKPKKYNRSRFSKKWKKSLLQKTKIFCSRHKRELREPNWSHRY